LNNSNANIYTSARKGISDISSFAKKRNSAQASPVAAKSNGYRFNTGNVTSRPMTSFAQQ